MKKTTKKAVTGERLIEALEGLVADYRAGRGDVLNRLAEGRDVYSSGAVSLTMVLTLALFGERAFPKDPVGGGSVACVEREYRALCSIGSGSAERGVALLVDAGLAWATRDREGLVAWASRALPKLPSVPAQCAHITRHGLFGAALWEIPVADPSWWTPLQEVTDAAMKPLGKHDCGDAVVRAMALEWNRPSFPGRAFAAPVAAR